MGESNVDYTCLGIFVLTVCLLNYYLTFYYVRVPDLGLYLVQKCITNIFNVKLLKGIFNKMGAVLTMREGVPKLVCLPLRLASFSSLNLNICLMNLGFIITN